MGKGDKKSKRGKIFMGSFGVRRRARKKKTEILPLVVKEPKIKKSPVIAEEPKEIKKEKKEPKIKVTASVEEPKEVKKEKKEPKVKATTVAEEKKDSKKESKKEPKK